MQTPIRSRLAPTPSGFLHRGNAFSFLLTWLLVRSQGGQLHLRIDDLDANRIRTEYIQDVFDTLEWLEMDYDTGPRSVEDFGQNWSQKRRSVEYHQALERLREQDYLFACVCSRSTEGAFTADGVYAGMCRNKEHSFDAPNTAWRVRSAHLTESRFVDTERGEIYADVAEMLGDVVVRRKDGIPAYQIASLVDDERDGMTLIVRGMDLLSSTAMQSALAQALGMTSFPNAIFLHHVLLLDDKAQKLSKSHDSSSLKEMRNQGAKPSDVYQLVAAHIGINARAQTLQELLEALRESHGEHHLNSSYDLAPILTPNTAHPPSRLKSDF
jgi:glutamyl/glutaminyl-tRNA synthetase